MRCKYQRTPRSLSAELLSSRLLPNLYPCLASLHPWCCTRHVPLLNFMQLMIFQCSNVFRSICKTSWPSRESTAPPSFVSSANLLRMHPTHACRPLIKTLSRTGSKTKPWGTPTRTCHLEPHSLRPFEPYLSARSSTRIPRTCSSCNCPEGYCEGWCPKPWQNPQKLHLPPSPHPISGWS